MLRQVTDEQNDTVRVSHGLVRSRAQVADLPGRAAALLTVCPTDTVIAGRTAALLHGLWLPQLDDGIVDVIVHRDGGSPSTRSYNKRRELHARRQALATDEVVMLHGLPVTSPARTWLDLAARFGEADLLALGDSVLRFGTSRAELDAIVGRARHRRGVTRARAVLPLLDARSRSRPESRLRWIILDAGLPTPAVNQAVHDDHGQWLFEPDLSYDDVRLALEYNGTFHSLDERMQRDIGRTVDVEQRGGWRVVTFGKRQVFGQPDLVASRVRTLRRECSILLGARSGPQSGVTRASSGPFIR